MEPNMKPNWQGIILFLLVLWFFFSFLPKLGTGMSFPALIPVFSQHGPASDTLRLAAFGMVLCTIVGIIKVLGQNRRGE